MLILSRKLSEQIVIDIPAGGLPGGSQILVTVAEIRGEKVRIGLEADSSVRIFRKEILDSMGDAA